MTISYAMLGILGQKAGYGYELKQRYDSYFGREKPLAFGQVYATLSRLLRDNKIAEEATERAGGPERKKYAITTQGRKDLEVWLAQPEPVHADSQSVLLTKVMTGILLNRSPLTFLDTQRSQHIARMRELTHARQSSDLALKLQADLALFHLEADLRWIDATEARLGALTKEIHT
ncbi:MAG TPA: PadR family transcriptional regulator [Candidatus Saccharimonadales bacterium]|nr:PadR family transcriptional regulator [Candidatus Saccharimonadales bacterium]